MTDAALTEGTEMGLGDSHLSGPTPASIGGRGQSGGRRRGVRVFAEVRNEGL